MAEVDAGDLTALLALLTGAHAAAARLASDPLIARLLQVIAKLPPADREPIVRILEREATWCRIVEQTTESTGISVRPNPHASLYVHVFEPVDEPSGPLRRDIDVIRTGMERFIYLAPLLLQEGVMEQWTASARELARDADPALRAAVARIAREALELIAEADVQAAAGGADTAAPSDVPVPDHPTSTLQRDRQ